MNVIIFLAAGGPFTQILRHIASFGGRNDSFGEWPGNLRANSYNSVNAIVCEMNARPKRNGNSELMFGWFGCSLASLVRYKLCKKIAILKSIRKMETNERKKGERNLKMWNDANTAGTGTFSLFPLSFQLQRRLKITRLSSCRCFSQSPLILDIFLWVPPLMPWCSMAKNGWNGSPYKSHRIRNALITIVSMTCWKWKWFWNRRSK